jgi:hypothetical protein
MPQQIQLPPQNLNLATNAGFGWGKAAGMLFAVIIPAALVAYANHKVFPDSSWIATGMIVTTCGIAGIFTVASGYATSKVRRYCLFAHLVLCIVLSANLAAHWVLSRQVSGAKQATAARHTEEDRADARRRAQVEDNLRLIESQRNLTAETTKQLRMEAVRNDSARRLGITAPRGARVSTPATAAALPSLEAPQTPTDATPRLTVEQVMNKWNDWLLWFAVADLLVSVVAFGICALMWEWDKNRNGIPDHLEQFILSQQYLAHPAQVVQSVQPASRPARQPATSQNGLPRP